MDLFELKHYHRLRITTFYNSLEEIEARVGQMLFDNELYKTKIDPVEVLNLERNRYLLYEIDIANLEIFDSIIHNIHELETIIEKRKTFFFYNSHHLT